jgi:glycosyltransferase involved in cell wall biosynthesis
MRFGGAYVLWQDPLILGCWGGNELSKVLSLKRPATVLFWPAWQWTMRNLPELARYRWRAYRQGKTLHFMCNSWQEDRILRRLGFPGSLVSSNCYIDEHLFCITGEAKKYDAVYTAQMAPFKRLHLAAKIPALYIVTYGEYCTPAGAYDLPRFEPAVSHADFNRGWATFEDIVSVLNRSRVGLALSKREGAMLASVEYMLCGLPLVTTPCRGGRELFLDERFVAVVKPTVEAVANGVREMISRDVAPELIRRATMARVQEHRRALCTHVQKAIEWAGGYVPGPEYFHKWFFGAEAGTLARFVLLKDLEAQELV